VLPLFLCIGLVAGCPNPIPGQFSETSENFQDNAEEMCEGDFEDCTPSEAIDVLDVTVSDLWDGSHANLNAAKVALDKGENGKAIGHLGQFIDKTEKERGKKVPEDDADFMIFVAQSITDEIDDGGAE
jgi:hypothetical protein